MKGDEWIDEVCQEMEDEDIEFHIPIEELGIEVEEVTINII